MPLNLVFCVQENTLKDAVHLCKSVGFCTTFSAIMYNVSGKKVDMQFSLHNFNELVS